MKRKLLALLLCTVIIFNNALPVLADGLEGEQTGHICGENCAEHPELVKCEVCGEVKCICNKDDGEDKTEPSENITEAPAVESCKICNAENCKAEHVYCETCTKYDCEDEHVYCETCAKYDCSEDHNAPVVTECECPDGIHVEGCDKYVAPVEPEKQYCECGVELVEGEEHTCAPVCSCGTETEEHTAECPLYVAPEVEKCEVCGLAKHEGECEKATCPKCEQEYIVANGHDDCPKKCNCVTSDGTHMEWCNAYVAPVIDPQYLALYEELLACETIEEFDAIICSMTEEEVYAFVDAIGEDKCMELDALIIELEEKANEELNKEEEIVEEDTREIVYHVPTVDFTDAAPFLDPVEGEKPSFFASLFSLRNSSEPVTVAADENVDNGLELDKSVSEPDENGVYTLTLEAWATGAKTTIVQEKNVPTDIVLVLDQSGSMDDDFTSTGYGTTSGTPAELYNDRNNLYVNIGNNTYSPVSVTRTSTVTGTTYTAYPNQNNSTYDYNEANLYHKCREGVYGKVSVSYTSSGFIITTRTYSYSCANGCTLNVGNNNDGRYDTPSFHNSLYRKTETTEYEYTFTYEKADGTTETATVKASESAPNWDFYESYASGNTTCLEALKSAATTFANQVANKAKGADNTYGTEDDVNHRIAMVGFAATAVGNPGNYTNTELFIGANQYNYNVNASSYYNVALQDMTTTTGRNNINASIGALAASGGTHPHHGMEMANGIFNAYPVQANETRNRVVIVFTDGVPGRSGFDDNVANSAINMAKTTKSTYGATVYTVGIFSGADASSPSPLPTNSGETNKANRFMHLLSSNYLTATSMTNTGSVNDNLNGNGYYLSASDSSALNTIFRTISQNIENGGSTTTLDAEAVVKDVITEQFVLPEGTTKDDITVYTADYSESGFGTPVEFDNAEVTISADGRTVSVTNFNYAENWVGTETAANGNVTYRGKKLLITIPIKVSEGFWGGNGVETNGAGSGVYEDSSANTPIEEFESPTVDVAIHVPAIEAHNQVIYYGNEAPAGNVLITHETIPAELWKIAYVNVETPAVGSVSNTANGSYTGTMTVTPINKGTYNEVVVSATANVNILVPTATHSDITIYQGNTPEFNNCSDITWVDIESGDEMTATMGEAPDVTVTYSPAADTENAFMNCTPVTPTVAIEGTDYSEALDAFDVHVIIPKVTVNLTDDQHYYGAEYTKTDVTGYTTDFEWTKELNGHTDIPAAQGNPPQAYEVSLKYFTDSSKENELTSFVMPNAETLVYVEAYHDGEAIEDALFNTTCDVDDCADHNNGYFTVHPLTCSLIIKKSGWETIDPNESFIFTLNGDNKTYPIKGFKVVVNEDGEVQVNGLPVGNYTVTEDENWSWRYNFIGANSVELTDGTVKTITATNNRVEALWLDFATWCKNLFTGDGIKQTKSN